MYCYGLVVVRFKYFWFVCDVAVSLFLVKRWRYTIKMKKTTQTDCPVVFNSLTFANKLYLFSVLGTFLNANTIFFFTQQDIWFLFNIRNVWWFSKAVVGAKYIFLLLLLLLPHVPFHFKYRIFAWWRNFSNILTHSSLLQQYLNR